MRTTIEMAREAGFPERRAFSDLSDLYPRLERFAELVRADERNSWPAEIEAMERQVNILTDALVQANADAERYRKLVVMEADLVEPITIWHYLRNPDELDAAILARSST